MNDYGQAMPPLGLSNVIAICAARSHSLALKSDGTVVGWGASPAPAGLVDIVAISDGLYLRRDGRVQWGDSVKRGLSNVMAVASGQYHSLVLTSNGNVIAWDVSGNPLPVPASASNVMAIAASPGYSYHSLALRRDGTVIAWGANGKGQTIVPFGLSNVVGIAAGGTHSLALVGPAIKGNLHNAIVYETTSLEYGVEGVGRFPFTWQWQRFGTNLLGATNTTFIFTNLQLADAGTYRVILQSAMGTVVSSEAEVTVLPADPVITSLEKNKELFAGANFRLQVSFTGLGAANFQWLKNGTNLANATSPDLLLFNVQPEDSGLYALAISNSYGSTIKTMSELVVHPFPEHCTVAAWGRNDAGQISVPNGLSNVTAIAAGRSHSLALTKCGAIVGWGATNYGQTVPPSGLTNIVAIDAGNNHSLALTSAGQVVAWGLGTSGQTNVPVGLTNVIAIASGQNHSLALRTDGSVVAWGQNAYGESTVPTNLTGVIAIAAGEGLSMALRADGTITSWGYDGYGTVSGAVGQTQILAMAAGSSTSMALREDGSIAAWGYTPGYGATIIPIPSALTNVIGMASLGFHTLALQADGLVAAWGFNDYGQATVPTNLAGVIAIDAGIYHSLALKVPAPEISLQPMSATRGLGDDLVFTVEATTGIGPLSFQWLFNGQRVNDATNSSLRLTNLSLADTGFYSVVVSSPAGSSTSAVATLIVNPGPLLCIRASGDDIVLAWANSPLDFIVQCTGELSPSSIWTNLDITPVTVDGETTIRLPASEIHHFFRLKRF